MTSKKRSPSPTGSKTPATPVKASGLTKAALVDVVHQRHGGLTKTEAAKVVEAIFSTLKSTLVDGRPVRIKNFGTFEVTKRAGRVGVNPTNGERLFIPAHKGLAFRPARRLKATEKTGKAGSTNGPTKGDS